jgi:hypothetical protein
MIPVRYGLNFYILFRRNPVFKGLNISSSTARRFNDPPNDTLCSLTGAGRNFDMTKMLHISFTFSIPNTKFTLCPLTEIKLHTWM